MFCQKKKKTFGSITGWAYKRRGGGGGGNWDLTILHYFS